MFEWLPEFALGHTECASLDASDAVLKLRKIANNIYNTDKFERRGEFGELLLHILLRQVFGTIPAISKMFYKDSHNDTVKGFDAVHVVHSPTENALELWLGEVKFYENITAAIAAVLKELGEHTDAEYLKGEFAAITNKIDPAWPHSGQLTKLLHPNTSLDEVFKRACIPVLLTYDSDTLAAFNASSAAFTKALNAEYKALHKSFADKLKCQVKVHLFLLPMSTKKALLAALDERLKAWQKL